MIKFYSCGEEFLLDNKEILDLYPLETSFYKLNSKSIDSFTRENYIFKLYDQESYLLVLHFEPYNLLLFGDKKFAKEASDIICDYHLKFYGVLGDKELVDEFYERLIERRKVEPFLRHRMDMMYLENLKEYPTMSVVNAREEDIDSLVKFMVEFQKECLHDPEPFEYSIRKKVTESCASYYVLKVDEEIVSVAELARVEEKIAAITSVYTLPSHRNKGYSRQVVSHICAELIKQNKIPYLYVDKDNPISNHLYTKIGFVYGKSKYDVAHKKGNIDTLILAGGCFWCMSKPYYEIEGVTRVLSGYSGGEELFPTYELVKDHKTGHRETILIEFDKTKLSARELLDTYFSSIDPFDNLGQFIDKGFNYTCAIFSDSDSVYYYYDKHKTKLEKDFNNPVYVDFLREQVFFKAEEYHQDYALKNPKEMEEELIASGRIKK